MTGSGTRFHSVRTMMFGMALAGCLSAAHAQRSSQPTPPQQPGLPSTAQTGSGVPDDRNQPSKAIQEKQATARNDDRQKRLVADTDKLLALATQLHDDVGKTDKNILSIDVVRRAEEIEKLARSVKERMKG